MKDTTVTDDCVYWEMVWGERYPDKPPKEMMFEVDQALARLLAEEIIYISDHSWKLHWSDETRNTVSLNVNCNDVFAWACVDAEEILHSEIQSLYDMWYADPGWGPTKWCCIKRNQQPQDPMIELMKKDGVWDDQMEALPKNTLDAEIHSILASVSP